MTGFIRPQLPQHPPTTTRNQPCPPSATTRLATSSPSHTRLVQRCVAPEISANSLIIWHTSSKNGTVYLPSAFQVDFTEENKGRHLDSTKRKISWKFGFAHPPAIFPHLFDDDENYVGYREGFLGGETKVGVDCRGREHEITLMWSLISGKAHVSSLYLPDI